MQVYTYELTFSNLWLRVRIHFIFSAYQLVGYAEGQKMSEMFAKKTLPKGGIPVLFIPGNSGSAKQVSIHSRMEGQKL